MDIHPEMYELRKTLETMGVEYVAKDEEFGTNLEGDQVSVDDWDDVNADSMYAIYDVTHIEMTTFASSDGRVIEVSYVWTIDDDGRKVFCSRYGDIGYLEMRVGNNKPEAAYAEDVIETAFGHCR